MNPVFQVENGVISVSIGDEKYQAPKEVYKHIYVNYNMLKDTVIELQKEARITQGINAELMQAKKSNRALKMVIRSLLDNTDYGVSHD